MLSGSEASRVEATEYEILRLRLRMTLPTLCANREWVR